MKTVRIKSNIFKDGIFKFDSFEVTFDKLGVAEIELKNEQMEDSFTKTIESYPQICYLEDSANEALEEKKKGDIVYLNKIIESKEEEVKGLKMANEELTIQLVQLQTELKYLRQNKTIKVSIKEEKIVTGEDIKFPTKVADDSLEEKEVIKEIFTSEEEINKISEENSKIYSELNSKTIPQLKDLLSDTFKEFESEWISLTKKDKIITYILNKTLSLDK